MEIRHTVSKHPFMFFRHFFPVLTLLLSMGVTAQSQWRFHLAFEDATGARDTIWFIFDENATLGVDAELGEGRVQMDLDSFNVWVNNWGLDSTKSTAMPYTFYPYMDVEIQAFNFQFPVILRWDPSLFEADYLPSPMPGAQMQCDHFFSANNTDGLHVFDMTIDDSVQVEMLFPNDALFPLLVNIGQDLGVGVGDVDVHQHGMHISPNPVRDRLVIADNQIIQNARILDSSGRVCMTSSQAAMQATLNVVSLAPGIYHVLLQHQDGTVQSKTFIKEE